MKLCICAIKPSNVWVKAMASRGVSLLGNFCFSCHYSLMASHLFNFGIMIYQRWHFFLGGVCVVMEVYIGQNIWYDYFAVIIDLFILGTLIYNSCDHFFGYIISKGNNFLTRGFAFTKCWWHCCTRWKLKLHCGDEVMNHLRTCHGYAVFQKIFTSTWRWQCHVRFAGD
jgi:hypothetical protein